MNKEKLLNLLSEAIDNGAVIEVSFYGSFKRNGKEAKEIIKPYEEVSGVESKVLESDGTTWLSVDSPNLRTTCFYSDFLIDDLTYEGGDELESA